MAITGMESDIGHPPLQRRRWGLLIDNAYELTIPARKKVEADGVDHPAPALPHSEVTRGVTFSPLGCDGPQLIAEPQFCDDQPDGSAITGSDRPIFEAFRIRMRESCSALDVDLAWLNDRLDTRMSAMASEGLALILMGGSGSSPSLENSATVVSSIDLTPREGLAALEVALANSLHGGAGMLHLPPPVFTLVSYLLEREGDQWYTPTGHLVVSDAGYTGLPPEGETADDGIVWAYASGMVGYQLSPPSTLDQQAVEYLDRTDNTITGRIIANGVLAFEPCTVSALPINITDTPVS